MISINKFWSAGIVYLLTVIGCSESDPVNSNCEEDISGTVSGVVTLVFNNTGGMTGFQVRGAVVNGSVKATTDADLTITSVDSSGTIHFEGSHTFYDAGNILFKTSDKGQMTAEAKVENHLTIVEGKSGEFITKGSVNLQTGALTLTYEGKACMQ